MSPLEIAGFVTGVVAVYLTARQVIWCWPLGIVNVLLYAVVFYQVRLYADMGLQLVYAGLCAYGWWSWRHGGRGGGALVVQRLDLDRALALAFVGIVAGAGLGTLLARTTDAALPYFDAGTAAFSLIAQWMQTRKLLESWLVWIAVDVVYVGMYVSKDLWLTAVLYAVFLGLALVGFAAWRKSLDTEADRVQAAAAADAG